MKSLDLTAMENIQGGLAGIISINLPINALLASLGLGGLLGLGLAAGVGFNLTLPGLNSLGISL
ncbi:hypothetical protein ACX0G9_03240 [Flavitalea flava]